MTGRDPTRVAVVGAGIVGCLIAREITRRAPDTDVVVLDRDGVGTGASRRSAGLHFPRGSTERVRRMSAHSEEFYAGLRASDPGMPIHPLAMTVVAGAGRTAELRQVYLPGARLTPATGTGDPNTRVPDDSLAWTVQGAQYADVGALAARLSPANRREGVVVTAVDPHADGVQLRLSTGDEVDADRVVLAPGPWVTDPAWSELLAPLRLRVKRVVALHLDRPASPDDTCLVLHDEDAFLLPMAHRGHWLFSYTCQEWDADPGVAASGVQQRHLAEARTLLDRYAPTLAAHCRSGRVFCDAYTPDRQPLVRALDPADRVVFAGGANGSGYRLGPAIAGEAVDLLDLKGTP
ncbi:NAD(P)/FAD-dependent oxidoreductase [Micromonospora sp. LOL_024]|uniref:NAD(P)/FAD-dependent oxidoreductase n=1 Tax=Micromonospora sp. LOL_024 TaxID=3345412 RepID=UPI003A84A8BD